MCRHRLDRTDHGYVRTFTSAPNVTHCNRTLSAAASWISRRGDFDTLLRRSGARALDPLDHFVDRQHDHCRSNAPPNSGENTNDHSDSDDRREPDDLGPTEMDASGLRHRFIMPSADARTSHVRSTRSH